MGKWKTVANVVTYPLVHPQKTARTAFSVGKTAAVTGAVGYVGWEALTKDKSVARVVSETVIGEGATNAVVNTVTGVPDLVEGANERIGEATAAIGTASQGLNGISNFLGNMFGGNGGNMFTNFFRNITSGNVSGLGIFGLVGAALLMFGRTGWFGKIAGALLAMLVIGNNSQQRQQDNHQKLAPGLPYSRASVYSPDNDPSKVFVKAWDSNGKELPATELTREHYDMLSAQKLSPIQIYHQVTGGQNLQEDQSRQTGYSR